MGAFNAWSSVMAFVQWAFSQGAVLVDSVGDMRHGAFRILGVAAVLGGIGAGELREGAGRGRVRQPQIIEAALGTFRADRRNRCPSVSRHRPPVPKVRRQPPPRTPRRAGPRCRSQRFSTHVTGMFGSREDILKGSADLPALCSWKNRPSQAISSWSQ